MTTMYNKSQVKPHIFGNMIEDLFANGIHKMFGDEPMAGTAHAPVNIADTESAYELQLVAPGLKKEDFKVSVDRNLLTIAFEQPAADEKEEKKWLRKEFRMKSFKRSFTMNERIDASGITAQYLDGILHISLPKKELEQTKQEINVN
jgi:HSP20 family protein